MAHDCKIVPISSAAEIQALAPLLVRSAGYETDIAEEIEYFANTNPQNWWMAEQNGKPTAFVRNFDQSGSTPWGVLELFIASEDPLLRKALTRDLLSNFLAGSHFPKGYRLRFETLPTNLPVIDVFRDERFTDRVEKFLHYENKLEELTTLEPSAEAASEKDAQAILLAFSNLHPVSESEVIHWIKSERVFVQKTNGQVTSAVQMSFYDRTAEVVRLATNKEFLQQGSGYRLLTSVHTLLSKNGIETVFLKVDELKQPARRLYEKLGYQHTPAKDQIWMSKIF